MTIEAMKQALEFLESGDFAYPTKIAADLRQAIEQAEKQEPVTLQDNEQYRMQMAGICTAAIGYWKEGDSIHPDYDTPALREVAQLYTKYALLFQKLSEQTEKHEPVAWEDVLGAIACGWTYPENARKPMDVQLAVAIAKEIQDVYTTPPAAEQASDEYGYAKRLAEAIWQKHYKAAAPQWKPLDDLMGVLTQIDNMTSGLTAPTQRQSLTRDVVLDIAGDFTSTFKHGGTTFDQFDFEGFARAIEAAHGITGEKK